MKTLSEAVFEAHRDKLAIALGNQRCTYGELAERARAHVDSLLAAGIAPGSRVAVVTTAHLDAIAALIGHALHGFVSVPVNPALGSAELEHVLRDAAPRAFVATDAPEAMRETLRAATRKPPPAPRTMHDSEPPALVLYTSGTTGLPKGAVLTHGNLASNLDALRDAWELSPEVTIVHALPIFHVHGLVLGLFGALRLGATLVWHERFSPERIAEDLAHTRGVLYAVPTMYRRLADAVERAPELGAKLGKARLLVSGSAPMPEREHERFQRLVGRRVIERYGLTETLINTAMRASSPTAFGTVGRAVDGVAVRLVDDARVPAIAADGATLGEVAVKGPNVFAGYLNRPDATAAVIDAEGWFYTGDLATLSADGTLRIVGRRATDLIKTGGFKVGAGEVEAALLEHPAVVEAAVAGVPDDDLGERIVAWIVLSEGASIPSEDELVAHVATRLSPHKRPREVHVVTALPRNAMGKVLKPALRTLREEGRAAR